MTTGGEVGIYVTDKKDIEGVFNILREKIVLLLDGIKYKEGVK